MKKSCWLAQQFKKGWRLGVCVGEKKTVWLQVWFKSEVDVEQAVRRIANANIVFVHMKGDKK